MEQKVYACLQPENDECNWNIFSQRNGKMAAYKITYTPSENPAGLPSSYTRLGLADKIAAFEGNPLRVRRIIVLFGSIWNAAISCFT
jgi:hypothetical protein